MRRDTEFGQDRKRDMELVRQVREVIGSDLGLVVHTPGARGIWEVSTAIRWFPNLQAYRVRWIKQPLPPHDLEAHTSLRAAVEAPRLGRAKTSRM
jgi:L-alanine-DL-glutamate epimerase-like enolase superfamily enzyme